MKKILIAGSSGLICNKHKKDPNYLLKLAGQNTGNLIFQYAVRQLLSESHDYVNIGVDERYSYQDIDINDFSCAIIPAANHFRPNVDWTDFNKFLEKIPIPLLVLGLGIQSELNDSISSTILELKKNETVVRMAKIFSEKALFIGVRGLLTAEVCKSLGMNNVEITGCPSLLINPSPCLGQIITNKIKKINNSNIKPFAIAAESPYMLMEKENKKIIEQQIVNLVIKHKAYYIQQSGGVESINFATASAILQNKNLFESFKSIIAPSIKFDKLMSYLSVYGRVFFSAADWIDFCSFLSFVIGLRMHGSMAALASGIPGIVIKHDSRVSELCDSMHLPNINMAEISSKSPLQLEDIIDMIKFNPESFDKNRSYMAKRIIDIFSNHNIAYSEKLSNIAQSN